MARPARAIQAEVAGRRAARELRQQMRELLSARGAQTQVAARLAVVREGRK